MEKTIQQTDIDSIKPIISDEPNPETFDDCLYDTCMEELDSCELTNLVVADKRYHSLAETIFVRKFTEKFVIVSNLRGKRFNTDKLHASIQLLNCFGSTITKLCIRFKLEHIESLLDAVVNNCGDNIVELKINQMPQKTADTMEYENGYRKACEFVRQLDTRFSKLRQLTIIYGNKDDDCPYWNELNGKKIPFLTHFAIHGRFDFDIFKSIIAANPSIEDLSAKCDYAEAKWNIPNNFDEFLDEQLPRLECLEIDVACVWNGGIPKLYTETDAVYFANLKKLTCVGPGLYNWNPNLYAISGEKLEQLRIAFMGYIDHYYSECLARFKKLKYLTIEMEKGSEITAATNLATNLANSVTNLCDMVIIEMLKGNILKDNTQLSGASFKTGEIIFLSQGIKEIILAHGDLMKITIRRPNKGLMGEMVNNYKTKKIEQSFESLFKYTLRGAQWKMRGNIDKQEFYKSIEN